MKVRGIDCNQKWSLSGLKGRSMHPIITLGKRNRDAWPAESFGRSRALQTASDSPVGFRVDINLQAIVHAIIIPARRN
jgi:hypothetical protein